MDKVAYLTGYLRAIKRADPMGAVQGALAGITDASRRFGSYAAKPKVDLMARTPVFQTTKGKAYIPKPDIFGKYPVSGDLSRGIDARGAYEAARKQGQANTNTVATVTPPTAKEQVKRLGTHVYNKLEGDTPVMKGITAWGKGKSLLGKGKSLLDKGKALKKEIQAPATTNTVDKVGIHKVAYLTGYLKAIKRAQGIPPEPEGDMPGMVKRVADSRAISGKDAPKFKQPERPTQKVTKAVKPKEHKNPALPDK